jgi:hypothetical protein
MSAERGHSTFTDETHIGEHFCDHAQSQKLDD